MIVELFWEQLNAPEALYSIIVMVACAAKEIVVDSIPHILHDVSCTEVPKRGIFVQIPYSEYGYV